MACPERTSSTSIRSRSRSALRPEENFGTGPRVLGLGYGAAPSLGDGAAFYCLVGAVGQRTLLAFARCASFGGAVSLHASRAGKQPATGIEPATSGLQNQCSTVELRRRRIGGHLTRRSQQHGKQHEVCKQRDHHRRAGEDSEVARRQEARETAREEPDRDYR